MTQSAATHPSPRPDSSRPPEEADEEKVEDAVDRIVDEGVARLGRGWLDLLVTAVVAGVDVGFGVIAYLVVDEATGSQPLAGLAFGVGFVALLLGHSELFTEGFLVPVTAVAARKASVRQLLKLWVGTLTGNLVGGLAVGALIARGFPRLRMTIDETATTYVSAGLHTRTLCLAVLAGGAITVLTRMHHGTESEVAKVLASFAIAFVLAGTGLFHSVLDSVLAFTDLSTGDASFGWLDWLGWVWWVLLANMAGGLVLTTLLRLVRSREQLREKRAET